ncbi:MAG: 30S ribosomal protein S6 [Candidatus Shapirobacteria bacterium]|jgi:ribosomal protein S6
MAEKQKYEIVLVFSPKAGEKPVEVVAEQFKKFGWKDGKMEHLGVKPLAYPIADQNKGDFWMFKAEGKEDINFSEINLYLNRNTDIIRYLVLKN